MFVSYLVLYHRARFGFVGPFPGGYTSVVEAWYIVSTSIGIPTYVVGLVDYATSGITELCAYPVSVGFILHFIVTVWTKG